MADLESAIEKAEQAVRITPSSHPNLAGRHNNLENVLQSRYECTGNMADLESAIKKAEQAVHITPSDHPDLAAWLNNLGSKLKRR
jgi:tetratricopeptide (TPR) repeat protein